MENKNLARLESLIKKRRTKLESVSNFYEYFEKFAFFYLREVVIEIDDRLDMETHESLRFFSENPYSKNETRFFVMVQLFMRSHKRNSFYLDNSEIFPSIKFEGDEFTGTVKSTIFFKDKTFKSTEYSIMDLNNKEKVFEIMLNFLETIYNI